MTSFKLSVRIIGIALMVTGFAASCAQLLGDLEVVGDDPDQVIESNFPDAGSSGPEVICELGTTQCTGRLLELCTDAGTAWVTLQACASEALCESNGLSTVSACIKPSCAAEEMSCNGATLRVCNPDRSGWDQFAECDSPAHCNAGNRRCEPSPCVAGERRCNVGNLERCQDDRLDWEPLDSCATNELCLATVEAATAALIASGGPDLAGTAPEAAEGDALVVDVSACLLPPCVDGEVRCQGAQLDICNEGRTAFESLELCATDVLCTNTLTYVGLGGRPRCRQAVCDFNEHQCTESGILQVCTPGREGYQTTATCIGPPFCNASAADRGEPGCTDAECAAGETQCNGAQIQRCLDDRTAFEPLGAACETRGLCNDNNPLNVQCDPAACQRGQFSGTEFRCQGATLQRCNDQHTGYDTINTCASAGLCNPGLGLVGCVPPVCNPGETRCTGDFLQICNGQRTAFEDLERCAAGTCDGTAGRCADPCIVGTARCNAQGEVEECRNRLVGREVTARCVSPQLCDATARACRPPPAGCTADGVRRCRPAGADTVLEVCAEGRSRFSVLDTCGAAEFCDVNNDRCDVCNQTSQPTCEGNVLVSCAANGQSVSRTTCSQGCQTVANGPDRCRICAIGSATCSGLQLSVCEQGASGEIFDNDDCETPALCQQTLTSCQSGAGGRVCQCQPGACDPTDVGCDGRQPLVCNADRTAMAPRGQPCTTTLCDADTGTCDLCLNGDVECRANLMFACFDGSRFEQILGANRQRCLSPTGPSQSCSGNTLNPTVACPSGICLDGTGCVECREQGFDPECTLTPQGQARTQCLGGELEPVLCANATNPCFVVGCNEQDGCTSRPKCSGALPFCLGNGTCVACTQNGQCPSGQICNASNACVPAPCTQDQCAAGGLRTCQNDGSLSLPPRTCDFPGLCNAAGTACTPCNAQRDCAPAPDACSTVQCAATGCVTTSRCTAGQLCEAGRCVNPPACGDGLCNGTDTTRNCPADCGSSCGDGVCNGEEGTADCPADCGTACGDRVANGNEACDGADLKGASVCDPRTETGTVTCSADCRSIVRTCQALPSCGDGVVNQTSEQCDVTAGVPASCGEGQIGQVTCNRQCQLDRSGCGPAPSCGDLVQNGNEACDGTDGVPANCGQGEQGEVRCNDLCQLDRSGCTRVPRCGDGNCNGQEATTNCPADCGSLCGDEVVNGPEQCEGNGITPIDCPNAQQGTRTCRECQFVDQCPIVIDPPPIIVDPPVIIGPPIVAPN